MPIQDHDILFLLKKNKQNGLDLLFDKYYKNLVILSDTYLQDLHLAEDVVQEQFIKFWNQKLYSRVKTAASLKNYLFTMVKNASINQIRSSKITFDSSFISDDIIFESVAKNMSDEKAQIILSALDELPAQMKKVIYCVFIQNMMYKEAAEELEISVNTVKSQLRKGIKKLKENLLKHQDLLLFWLMRMNQNKC